MDTPYGTNVIVIVLYGNYSQIRTFLPPPYSTQYVLVRTRTDTNVIVNIRQILYSYVPVRTRTYSTSTVPYLYVRTTYCTTSITSTVVQVYTEYSKLVTNIPTYGYVN